MPAKREICHLPCDCKVSSWKPFGNCSKPCYTVGSNNTGVMTRTREITEYPKFGGESCPHMVEQKACDRSQLELCPSFTWRVLDWQTCRLLDERSICGPGVSQRQMYCINANDPEMRPVNDYYCTDSKPTNRLACEVNCPIDCELGQWENWSPCSKSCGSGGYHLRRRKVLRAPAYGGVQCEATEDFKECQFVNCSWWHTGAWTSCFPTTGIFSDCGAGIQSRNVYCKSAINEVLPSTNCSGMVKPGRRQSCSIPCPDECAISEWSEWSPCTETCGPVGGRQMRTREILSPSNSTAEPCHPEEELQQTRVCAHWDNCNSYHWQVYPWETCVSNVRGTCGHTDGTQIRKVLCEMESAPHDDSLCDVSLKPNVSRPCNVICPIDCELSMWSEWSQCSVLCGSGTRYKTRRINTLPHFGGAACPDGSDENGIITAVENCTDIEPCYSYSWNTSDWRDCEHIGSSCGIGLQTRDVTCIRNDGSKFDIGVCMRELRDVPPTDSQQCFVPCAGDCGLTEWGNFGPCQRSFCREYVDGDYCRIRSREFINGEGIAYDYTNDQFNLCPHISARDFRDAEACEGPNYTYMWQEGIWRTCIPSGDKGNNLCGDGLKHRTVLCLRSDGVHVPEFHCDKVANVPASYKSCTIKCPQDCEVSNWGEWSVCSHNCGDGIRNHSRTITKQSKRGGRSCPPLTESLVCTVRSCDDFSWDVSEWSTCKPDNSNCGMGTQRRSVTCRAGEEYETECELREPRPDTSISCSVPCTGDCVLSEWSAFTPCPMVCLPDSVKTRTRTLVRQPSPQGLPCGSLQESLLCSVEDCIKKTLTLEIGNWQTCKPLSGDCGKGTRQRTISCHDNAGVYYDVKRCGESDVASMEDCEVECTQDCVLGRYGSWSDCNEQCGMDGHKFRERVILMESRGLGRNCPKNSHSLVQTMPCNVVPCFEYKFKRGEWSSCSISLEMSCGSGLRTRSIECRRSDGPLGSERDCLIELLSNNDPSAITDMEFELSSANRTQLDIHTSENCGRPCPGDCQVTNWSSFGPCVRDCFDASLTIPLKVRTRSIIKEATRGGLKCPEVLQEERTCPVMEAVCPVYTWHTRPWNIETKKRDVWCEDQDGRIVTGGCMEKFKPISAMECSDACEAPFTECVDGQCNCLDGFQMFFNSCLPLKGCRLDSHCPLFSYCENQKCECNKGFIQDTSGLCKADGSYNGSSGVYEDESNIWIWIVIGVCFLLIIVFAVFCILIFRNHRRNALMKKAKEAEIAEKEKMDVTAL
ncbi:thrombospondin type-1 domain-containing protein 7A-like [Anneissia japonica]|uniref:thrombospondin type-1 domain-containing protein 7A-like n=1 Tax=Anneissia japonica TaxID=1529436 RepID=UPI0014254CF9|nr:thrombospondin type-1 domain-containing protein 7A-like [Anneissia japonica]